MSKCGKKTLVYSRVVGYHNPVQNWNLGKSAEFKKRKAYGISNSTTHICGCDE